MIGLPGHTFCIIPPSNSVFVILSKGGETGLNNRFIKGKDKGGAVSFFSREVHRCFFHVDSS